MPWVKGQSGNPGGRAKKPNTLKVVEAAGEHCEEAVAKVAALLNSDDEKIVIQAATFLRDTGVGRPSQVEFDIAQIPDERLIDEIKRRGEARREQAGNARGVDGSALHS